MKRKNILKGAMTGLIALTLMTTGLQSASAFGGSSSGSGTPPSGGQSQPPVNTAPPASSPPPASSGTASPNYGFYYEYFPTARTWACSDSNNPDAIASWVSYNRSLSYGSSQADGTIPPDSTGFWTFSGSYLADGRSVWTHTAQLGAGCVYKPAFVKTFGGYCVVSSTAAVEMTAPARKPLVSNTKRTPWGAGDKSIAGCNASRTGSVSVDTAITDPGQYHAYGASQVDVLWLKHYVSADLLGRTLPDEIMGYAPAAAQGVFDKVGTKNCSGWHEGVLLPLGDATQCTNQDGGAGTITCSVGSAPLVDIRMNKDDREQMARFGSASVSNQTMYKRDGITRRIDFTGGDGSPTISGAAVSNVVGRGTTFAFANFPWRAGLPVGGNLTDFTRTQGGYNLIGSYDSEAHTGKSTFWEGIHWNDAAVNFYWAGSAGLPATITPKWTFTADVTSSSIIINSIDPNSSTWDTTTTTTTNRESATCTGNPMNGDLIRAVGDSLS